MPVFRKRDQLPWGYIQIEVNIPVNELVQTTYGPIRLVSIQGTSLCNLNCTYCYLSETERALNNTLSLETAEIIFKELATTPYAANQNIRILWHSGEPLALPIDYYEKLFTTLTRVMEEYQATDRRFIHVFQTNGTLINQAWCEFIKKHNIEIGVSVDGPAAIHDANRKDWNNNATHSRVMRGIHLLQKNKIDLAIIGVLTGHALKHADEIYHFFKENGINDICFNLEEREGYNTSSSLEHYEDEYQSFMKKFWNLAKVDTEQPKVREFWYAINAILLTEKRLGNSDFKIVGTNQLTIPFMTLNIDYEGNFSTYSPELLTMKSSNYGDFILGNFRTDTIASVAASTKFERINRDIQAGVQKCQTECDYFDFCLGGKPSNKYHENGSFNSTETLECRLRTKMIIDLVLDDLEKQSEQTASA